MLKLLQWRCPPTRWNLKNPPDVLFLDAMTRIYPDARIIWTHRDPAHVQPSVCSLIATVRSIFCDDTGRERLGRAQLALWAEGMRRAMAFREQVGEGGFADVFMDDLVARPIDTVAAVYDRFGLAFGAEAERRMRVWLAANSQGKHGAHETTPAEFGLDIAEVREAFRPCTERFGVRLED